MKIKKNVNQCNLIEESKPLDKKKFIIRLVAFFVFLALGVTLITIGVTNIGRREEGLQIIEAAFDEAMPLYRLGVSFQHYFSGSSGEIKVAVRELEEFYTSSLKDIYRILDPVNVYEGLTNVATVNQSLGKEVTIPKELYDTLVEAVRFTEKENGYSLFAGALYAAWEEIRYTLNPAEFDPTTNLDQAERLSRLTVATTDLSNFSLEFLDDATCTVRFTVDQDYLDLLSALEMTEVPILNLNVLTEAWKLQLVAARLETQGYHRGFLISESGIALSLSGYTDGGDYCFFGEYEAQAVPAADLAIRPGTCAVQLRAFGTKEEPGYYSLTDDGKTLLRHPWLPADGRFRELLLSAFVSGEKLTAPEACYACLRLYGCETEDGLKTLAAELPGSIALLLRRQPNTVFVTDVDIRPETGYGYATKSLS